LHELEDVLTILRKETLLESAKSDNGMDDILRGTSNRLSAPPAHKISHTRALVFDFTFRPIQWSNLSVSLKVGDTVYMMRTDMSTMVNEFGQFCSEMRSMNDLSEEPARYIIAHIRNVSAVKTGGTVALANDPADEMRSGCKGLVQ
jgi:translation elongation factor EF-4